MGKRVTNSSENVNGHERGDAAVQCGYYNTD